MCKLCDDGGENGHEPAESQSELTAGLGALCGSAMAHHNCKYAGEITASRIHICNANGAIYGNCEYADKGGLIHQEHEIKVPNVQAKGIEPDGEIPA